MCVPSIADSLCSTVLSGSTHLGQKTSVGFGLRIFAGVKIYYRSDLLQQAETLVTVSPCEFPPRCHPSSSSPHPSLSSPRPVVSEVEPRRGSPFLSPCHPGPTYLSSPLSFWSAAIESRGSPLFPRISWFFIWHFRKFYIDYRQTTFSKKFRHEKAFP